MNRQGRNWLIAAALAAGYLALLELEITGLAVHQWLGLAIGALAGYHLLAHGPWLKVVIGRFFGRTSNQARCYCVVDGALLVGFLAIGVTGLAISTLLELPLANYLLWRDVHVSASFATLGLIVLKVGLHWRWIAANARGAFGRRAPAARSQRRSVEAPRLGRRQFVAVVGTFGGLALVAGGRTFAELIAPPKGNPGPAPTQVSAAPLATLTAAAPPTRAAAAPGTAPTATPVAVAELVGEPGGDRVAGGRRRGGRGVANDEVASSPTSRSSDRPVELPAPVAPTPTTPAADSTAPATPAAAPTATPTPPPAPSAAEAPACVVFCDQRCPYPGRCRRYVDANKNGLCDLGECL